MSLTSHLDDTGSAVRSFFVEAFPRTGDVVRATARALRNGQAKPPLAAAPDVNAGRAGTAVDYLLRIALAPDPCPEMSPGRLGAGMLGRRLSIPALGAVEEALAFVATTAPSEKIVSDSEWEDLARISLLLATFEAVYRSGLLPSAFAELASPPRGWRDWATLVCVDAEIEDVAVLGWAATEDHAELRGRRLTCNPTFTQSGALGGADADLITDGGLLIELKSTSTTRTCSNTDLWQLSGYALADTEDRHRIASVGLSLLRWRTRVVWPIEDFLDALVGREVDIADMRRAFAGLLVREIEPQRDRLRRRRPGVS